MAPSGAATAAGAVQSAAPPIVKAMVSRLTLGMAFSRVQDDATLAAGR
jgi:hypothetical protein